jgi:hypothetical protein
MNSLSAYAAYEVLRQCQGYTGRQLAAIADEVVGISVSETDRREATEFLSSEEGQRIKSLVQGTPASTGTAPAPTKPAKTAPATKTASTSTSPTTSASGKETFLQNIERKNQAASRKQKQENEMRQEKKAIQEGEKILYLYLSYLHSALAHGDLFC